MVCGRALQPLASYEGLGRREATAQAVDDRFRMEAMAMGRGRLLMENLLDRAVPFNSVVGLRARSAVVPGRIRFTEWVTGDMSWS